MSRMWRTDRNDESSQYRLAEGDVRSYRENGYLKLDSVFDAEEIELLREENDAVIETRIGAGPYDEVPIVTSGHIFESASWNRAIQDPRVVVPIIQLIGPNVELDHTTGRKWMPSESEQLEQHDLHQDRVFYSHDAETFINAIVYLDDFPEQEGGMRFVPGSHTGGDLEHVDGEKGPRLPSRYYTFDDTISVPAAAGDVILFHINVVHGTQVVRHSDPGTIVWVIYDDPEHSPDHEGIMVAGRRP